jgi:hypothetical protein
MLPILRVIPVGGVLLAIVILVLALSPPGASHSQLTPNMVQARGALIERGDHPEWRQFLILAATRRADELNRLRELPDTPVRTGSAQDAPKDAPKIAGLPADRSAADPDDATGSIVEPPGATLPVEIGEPSSTELPVTTQEEKPPVIRTPERVKPPRESRKTGVQRARRVKPPAKPDPTQFNLFAPLFDGRDANQAATAGTINP